MRVATFILVVSLLGAAAGICRRAAADTGELSQLLQKLGSDDRDELQTAIEALGARSEPAALRALIALRDGKLRVDATGRVLYVVSSSAGEELREVTSDHAIGAANGSDRSTAEQASPLRLRTPLVNNSLRRVLTPAIAESQLRSSDVAVRKDAADALSKQADETLAPVLHKALKRETDAGVRTLLQLAVAQIDFSSSEPARRIAAIHVMQTTADVTFKAQLAALLEKSSDGSFREPSADVRKAASSAVATIESQELLTRVVRDLFYGLSLGSVLLLAALGLAITFGLLRVINMAHGEMLMLGAYCAYVAQTLFQKFLPNAIEYYLVLAVPLAFAVCMLVGVILERAVIRFLYGRPLETLLATWGISLMLIQTVRLLFGAQNVNVSNPSWLSGGVTVMTGVVVPYNRIATIVFAIAIVLFIAYMLNFTRLGLQVRAITQNRGMAACMGIATGKIDTLAFGLGSAIAGLGGVALSQIGNVGPELGQLYIVDSFMVVVVGGVGKIAGSVVAALGLGAVNKLLEPLAGAVLGKILVLCFVVLFIQRRPQGLFALKGRAAAEG